MRWMVIALFAGLLLAAPGKTRAQEFNLMNGRMYITLPMHLTKIQLDSFVARYDLEDMDLSKVVFSRKFDKLQKMGWKIERNTRAVLQISKQILGPDDMRNPGKRMVLTEEHPTIADLFPVENDDVVHCSGFLVC